MSKTRYNLSHENRFSALFFTKRGVFAVAEKLPSLQRTAVSHLEYLISIRRGSKISRLFRHIFELKYIKSVVASPVALMVIASSFVPASGAATQMLEFDQAEEKIISQRIVHLKTEKGVQFPTNEVKLTQGYSWYHRGLDIDGTTGDPIRPVAPGIVSVVEYSQYGYGHSVLVKHGNELTSLYAHMSKIYVKPEQRVALDTVLGEMGSTGRSTGDHLHLEIRSGSTQINPLSVLH